ncbi:MAG: KilA-N domain-containing protein [Bacteroidetes bacterium]|nr:KilA-N domain-containing protein [Bacteroidota bacterium]MCL2303215.1 KilA-N domain-containing protein [Lentimicrobiaceae bacterium]
MAKINVKNTDVSIIQQNEMDYVSLTDIARHRDSERSDYILQNWMRNRNTIEFIGLWEQFNNPHFNSIEFDGIKNMAGSNSFALTPKRWIETTNAIGIISKTGRYGGTFAHRDIAFEFASWLSSEFKFYLIREFQRLKEEEQKTLGWSAKRELAKINYHIHTNAIKHNLIPIELTPLQISIIYANEADALNVALFGITAKEWRDANPDLKGNIRDYATINELICLSNMESLNAVFISEGLPQRERLIKLNQAAIQQMKVLVEVENKRMLK